MPFVLKEYQKDKGSNVAPKIINVFISFLIFHIYINTLRKGVYEILGNITIIRDEMFVQVGFLPPLLNGSTSLIYLVLCFVLCGTAILLALRKDKTRVFLIRFLPVMWVFESINIYKYIYTNIGDDNTKYLSVFVFVTVGIVSLVLFWIYSTKAFKKFFKYQPSTSADL
jgi:hypothetical protein